MVKQIRTALVAFILLTLITGAFYPLLMTGVGQVLFPFQANGSLIVKNGNVVGSSIIGQTTDSMAYFWWRPSAVNAMQGSSPESLIASGATNYGWTNAAQAEQVAERETAIRTANGLSNDTPIPADLLFASASGLDPHISPEAAALQINRVAEARNLDRTQVEALVTQYTESPQFGIFGEPRVNVLLLNLALDGLE
jgi:K+-transporting ATPase ATPase C chain